MFGEATGIVEADGKAAPQEAGMRNAQPAWYALDGRKLGGKPAQPGVYIKNGKKVVVE